MKAGGKSARTSLEEKTGAAPSVAKLPIDANGGRGELRALGGGKHDEWNQHLTAQLAGSLPEACGSMTATTVEGSLGALSGQIGIDPQDPVEGMLSAQMIAANAAALDLYRRAWIPESPAVSGWAVCRMHGARGGAPKGKANGNYKTGEHTAELREARRLVRAILRRTKDAEAVV